MSAEPSMEDILASIKRVIKEGEAQAPARRTTPRPLSHHHVAGEGHGSGTVAPQVPDRDRDAVLELNDMLHSPTPPPLPASPPVSGVAPAAEAFAPVAAPVASPLAQDSVPPPSADQAAAVSARTVEATRDALGALSRLVVKPEADSDGTLEGLVREMLRPMLGEWLDQNLPRLVEQMVAREIAKITRGQG